MEKKELKKILENHQHWWNEDCEGWENMCADLRGAYLYDAENVPYIYLLVLPGTLYHNHKLNEEMKHFEEYHRNHYFDEESMTWEEKEND